MKRGEFLSKVIAEKGFNNMSLAKASGVPYTTIRSMIERDLSNASIDNLLLICKVLDVPPELLADPENWSNDKTQPYYALTSKDERDIAKDLERIMADLDSKEALAFHGEPLDDEDRELLRRSLENSLIVARQMAKKKFTPKKYRN
ncbi:helix-turn-helix domain-containing protein [Cohnella boryungensis]|uniref:Helix-turn-helix domain-containing protein n=1 Tax=Cohnella boryungensis TaxID=768479 RepID=A0ABV8SDV6_9BACL